MTFVLVSLFSCYVSKRVKEVFVFVFLSPKTLIEEGGKGNWSGRRREMKRMQGIEGKSREKNDREHQRTRDGWLDRKKPKEWLCWESLEFLPLVFPFSEEEEEVTPSIYAACYETFVSTSLLHGYIFDWMAVGDVTSSLSLSQVESEKIQFQRRKKAFKRNTTGLISQTVSATAVLSPDCLSFLMFGCRCHLNVFFLLLSKIYISCLVKREKQDIFLQLKSVLLSLGLASASFLSGSLSLISSIQFSCHPEVFLYIVYCMRVLPSDQWLCRYLFPFFVNLCPFSTYSLTATETVV